MSRPKLNMIRTNFYFPQEMLDEMKSVKEDTGMTMSEFIRQAIEKALLELEDNTSKPLPL